MSYANNVKSTLNSSFSSSANSLEVVKAVAPYNDPPTEGKVTLMDSLSAPTKIEIISYTGRTDNTSYWTLTGVSRALESTNAEAFNAGANVFQTWTAGDAQAAINKFPFYKSNGTQQNITLVGGELPFYKSDGSASNIGVV